MNHEDDVDRENLWRLLHDTRAGAARVELDALLKRRPDLVRDLRAVRRADAALRECLPAEALTDEQLVDRLLRDYESDSVAPIVVAPVRVVEEGAWFGWLRAPAWAAAAALFLLGSALWLRPDALTWDTRVEPLAARGAPAAPVDMTRITVEFTRAIGLAYAQSRPRDLTRWTSDWRMTLVVREREEGAWAVIATARSRAGDRAMQWERQYDDVDALRADLDGMARHVAGDLVAALE